MQRSDCSLKQTSRFAQEVGRNVVHGSDSVESAAREIAIYFDEKEVLDYEYLPEKWLFE